MIIFVEKHCIWHVLLSSRSGVQHCDIAQCWIPESSKEFVFCLVILMHVLRYCQLDQGEGAAVSIIIFL